MMLSVTIATYNVEQYISECLDSILNQTFNDFELICIDDGSTDDTIQIINEYVKKDKRIRLIANQKNAGLAVIRNQSLKEAKGKYVFFLDGDDLYDPTYFEKAISLAEKNQSDIVISDYLAFYKESEIIEFKKTPSALQNIDSKNKKAILKLPAFACAKLLKTETAKNLGIYFPPGYTRQDIPVHWHLITSLDKISFLPEKLIFYRQQPNATTAKKNSKLFHLVYVMDIVEKYLKEQFLFEEYKEVFYTQQLNFFQGMIDNIKVEYQDEALKLIKERLNEDHLLFLKSTNLVRPAAKNFLLSLDGDKIANLKYTTWKLARKVYRSIRK